MPSRFARIVEVPQTPFCTAIVLNSGETSFGYSKATAGKNTNYMEVVEKSTVIKFDKHAVSKVLSPDELGSLGGYMMKCPKCGIVWLIDDKRAGIYMSKVTA